MKNTMKVYVVISDKDVCGDIPSALSDKSYDMNTIYDFACLAVFEKNLQL